MAIIMGRGYRAAIGAAAITLTNDQGTATWNDSDIISLLSTLNNGTAHFLVLDLTRSGGNWSLQTSVDGLDFVPQGIADINPTLAVSTVEDDPTVQIIDAVSSAFMDDVVMHSGHTTFTGTELDNLFELGNTFGEPLNEYTQRFAEITITLQSDPAGLSIIATTDIDGNGNGVSPFSRDYTVDTSVSFTAPASASGRVFLEWRNNGGDVVSTSRTLTKTVSEIETFKAFYKFVGDAANNYVIVSN